MNIDQILYEAGKAFDALDKAEAEVRAAKANLNQIRKQYDLANGTWGIRPESLRIIVADRYARFRKTA